MKYSDFTDRQLTNAYHAFRSGLEYYQYSQDPQEIKLFQALSRSIAEMEIEIEARKCFARMFITIEKLDDAIRKRKYMLNEF